MLARFIDEMGRGELVVFFALFTCIISTKILAHLFMFLIVECLLLEEKNRDIVECFSQRVLHGIFLGVFSFNRLFFHLDSNHHISMLLIISQMSLYLTLLHMRRNDKSILQISAILLVFSSGANTHNNYSISSQENLSTGYDNSELILVWSREYEMYCKCAVTDWMNGIS